MLKAFLLLLIMQNPSPNPNAYNACQNSPQQSQGQIPPFCAKLIVIKDVQGGTASPSDFTLSVTGTSVSQTTFRGSSSGTTVVLAPGSYQINEVSGPPGYIQGHTHHRCDVGTISAGQTIVCRIINIFNPPDTQPPQVLSFTIQPSTVSMSNGNPPGTITITAHLTDQTGVGPTPAQVQSGSGFTGAGIFIQSECDESPGFFQALPLHLVSGTLQDGVWQATFTFPASALNVSHSCNPNILAFEIGGLVQDTLGNQGGMGLQFVVLTS